MQNYIKDNLLRKLTRRIEYSYNRLFLFHKNENVNKNVSPVFFSVQLSESGNDSDVQKQITKYYFLHSIIKLFLGLVCIIGGILLLYNGIAGTSNWTAEFFGFTSELTDATPGVILTVVGLIIVVSTKFTTKIKK